MAVRFASDIRPLFRDTDVDAMNDDLSSYETVKNSAAKIHAVFADGSMPCDGGLPN